MADLLFYLFAFLTVLAAAAVVFNRNAVNAAMCLLLSFVGLAALFVLLEAYFLALLQVLVYAGAVVVLFLFVIMLFDVQGGESRRPFRWLAVVAGVIAFALLATGVLSLARHAGLAGTGPVGAPADGAGLKDFGYQLFTTYLLPVQVTGFLLLVAMLGVVVLSKRLDGKETAK
jgi:NADH-quinone oxidoreductase subunit J